MTTKPLGKSEKFVLVNADIQRNFIHRMRQLPCDGSITAVLQRTGSKSARQRGLQHIWYSDVVKSGLGGYYESDEDILDIYAKYRWGLRILVTEEIGPNVNGYLSDAWMGYLKENKNDSERMMWWVSMNVHTEDMSQNQMAQFLTEFQNYYGYEIGVELTDPISKGWENLLEQAEVA